MQNKQRTLLISSLILLPFTFVLFQLTTLALGPKWGYVTGFCIHQVKGEQFHVAVLR